MTKILLGVCACAVVACGDDSARHTCGAGTTVSGGMCVGVDGGVNASCGSGTHQEGDTCVPDPAGGGTAPTATAITPGHAGISGLTADGGGVFFEITGAGFADPKGGAVTVTFGSVKAAALVMDDMTIDGIVPSGTSLDVMVTVANANGSATLPFQYDALIAADGHGSGGDAYVLDPDSGLTIDLGPLTQPDGAGSASRTGITGLAFDASGTLFAATVGTQGDPGLPRALITIDMQTGAPTLVGPFLVDGVAASATDLKFVGSTLYAAALVSTSDGTQPALATVDPASGTMTTVAPMPGGRDGDALGIDGSGSLIYSGNGTAGDGSADGGAGALYALDSSGVSTQVASLDYTTTNAAIPAMATEHGRVYAVINLSQDSSGGTALIATLDPTNGHLEPLAVIPPRIDAIAAPPAAATLPRSIQNPALWHVTTATAIARCAPLHAVPAVSGTVTVGGCDGASRTVTLGTRYALIKNRRGIVKLVDRTTRQTLVRNVISVR